MINKILRKPSYFHIKLPHHHLISKGFPEFISMAGEGVELIFLSDDLFFLILNASFLESITTPDLGIFPNNISIPLLSLKAIPSVSSSTIFRISLVHFLILIIH